MSDDDDFDEVGADESESADSFDESSSEKEVDDHNDGEAAAEQPHEAATPAAEPASASSSSSSFSSVDESLNNANAAGHDPLPRSPRPLDLSAIAMAVASAAPVKEGYLMKKGGKRHNWLSRWFVLSPTSLTYWSAPGKSQKGDISLVSVLNVQPVDDIKKHPFSIAVTVARPAADPPVAQTSSEPASEASSSSAPPTASSSAGSLHPRVYQFKAKDADERDAWLLAIRTAAERARAPAVSLISPRSSRTPRTPRTAGEGDAASSSSSSSASALSPGRDPGATIRTGNVKVEVTVGGSSASFKSLWLVLSEHQLAWWSSQKAIGEDGKKPVGAIARSEIREPATIAYTSQKFTFRVPYGPDCVVIAAESNVDREEWLAAINQQFRGDSEQQPDAAAVPGSYKLSFMRGDDFSAPVEVQFKVKLPNGKSFLSDLSKKSTSPVWRNAIPLIVDPATQVYPVYLVSARKKPVGYVEVVLPTSVEQEQPTWYDVLPPLKKKKPSKIPITGRVLLQVTRTAKSTAA